MVLDRALEPAARIRVPAGRLADHELAGDLAREQHHPDRAHVEVPDLGPGVVTRSDGPDERIVLGPEVVGHARGGVLRPERRTGVQQAWVVPERAAAGRLVDDQQQPEPDVGHAGEDVARLVGDLPGVDHLTGGEEAERRGRGLLSDDDSTPEVPIGHRRAPPAGTAPAGGSNWFPRPTSSVTSQTFAPSGVVSPPRAPTK